MIDLIKNYGVGTDFGVTYDPKQKQYSIWDDVTKFNRPFDITDFDDFMDAVEESMHYRGFLEGAKATEKDYGG
jgi:hypothetical protein